MRDGPGSLPTNGSPQNGLCDAPWSQDACTLSLGALRRWQCPSATIRPMQATVEVAFGPYRLDTRGKSLLRGGEPVALSPYEFEVLHVLVRVRTSSSRRMS